MTRDIHRPRGQQAGPQQSGQQGYFTLIVSLILLVFVGLIVASASKTILFGLKTSNDQYHQAQALQAAQGGLEFAAAWALASGNNPSNWSWTTAAAAGVSLPPDIQAISSTMDVVASPITVSAVGNYTPTINAWRLSSTPRVIELQSVATSGDATASVRQIVTLGGSKIWKHDSPAAVVINGCILGSEGHPVVDGASGVGVMTDQSNAGDACIDESGGHLRVTGSPDISASVSMPGSTPAWSYVFGISTSQMAALAAQYPNTIYYYGPGNPAPDPFHDSLGSPTSPVILIFDTGSGCPKINGGTTIYGYVYFGSSCTDNGWGGATVFGTVIVDGTITKLNANATIQRSGTVTNSGNFGIGYAPAKVPGSWRDF